MISAAVSGGASGASGRNIVDHDFRLGRHREIVQALLLNAIGSNTFYYGANSGQQPGRKTGQQHDPRLP